jgi:hypothetical protein
MDYLKVFLVLAPQLIAGCLIYLMILKRDEVALVELLSIGGVFGIVTSTIFDQIFVNLQLPRIGWLVPLLVVLVVFRIGQNNQAIVLPKIQTEQAFKKTILPILAISAAALGTEWFWLFPSGVLFCFAAFLSIAPARTYSRIAIRLTNLAALIAGVIMIANRPKIWWFLYDDDYAFLQGLSHSLANWGINDYFLQSGIQTRYHWFTYAWVGLVERSSTATTFFVLTRIAPVIFAVLVTGVIWSLINQFSTSKLRTFVATLVTMCASSNSIWGGGTKILFLASPSQFYAFAALFTGVFLLLQSNKNLIRYPTIIVSMFSFATILSKTMHGVVFAAAVLFALAAQPLIKRRIQKSQIVVLLGSIFSLLLTYFVFIANSEAGKVFEIRFGDFFWQLQGDARLLPENVIDVIGFLTVIGFAVLPLLIVFANCANSKLKNLNLIDLLSIGAILSGISLALIVLAAWGENLYFLQASISLSTALGLASLTSKNFQLQIPFRSLLKLLIYGVTLCLLSFMIPSLNSGAKFAIIIRSMKIYAPAWIIISLLAVKILIEVKQRKATFSSVFKSVIITSAMVVTFSVINWLDTAPRKNDEFSRNGETYIADIDLSDLTRWVNENTTERAVVASNFGWPKIEQDDFKNFRAPCLWYRNKEIELETCMRTKDALLVAYMHRRTWLQATSVHYTGFTPEMDLRQTTTLGFAAEPNAEHLQQMESDGVTWYVVDRSTTDRTNWEPYATVRYTNDSFYVLELNTAD